ncbi:MAG: hypothetical protein ABH873_02415 [Candidatus Firestonebacteria bacterium]
MSGSSEKKGLSIWLEEFNINKTDIIIYSVNLGILIILIIMFILISNDLQNKIGQRRSNAKKYEKALTLKSEADKIKLAYSTLPKVCEILLDKFVAQNEMSDFVEYVKTMATTFKGKEISASPSPTSFEEKIFSVPDEVADFFVEKGVFKENDFILTQKGKNMKVVFTKQPLRIDMGMSLGNLLAFLYCLENSSKYINVASLSLSGGGESDSVRVSMTVNGYQLSKGLIDRIHSILSETPLVMLKNNIKKILDKSNLSDEQLKVDIKNILKEDLTPESKELKNNINQVLSETSLVSVVLKNKIKEVLSKTRKSSEIKVVKSLPRVSRVTEKRVLKEEVVKYDNNIEQRVRSILSVPVPPPPPPPPKPENIRFLIIMTDLVSVDVDGKTYHAFIGKGPFRSIKKESIPGFENLKIIKKDDNKDLIILDNNGVTSDIPFKK